MSKKLRPLAAVAVVALISLISAGCGSNAPSETGTVSSSSAGTGGNKKATDRDKAVKFAECMRENGVSECPDPNASGDFVFGVNVSPAVWRKALDACKGLQPPGALDAKRSPRAAVGGPVGRFKCLSGRHRSGRSMVMPPQHR
jgi:hypothetical protein